MPFRRRKTREIAMQILFAWDSHGGEDMAMAYSMAADASNDEEARSAAVEIAKATWDQCPTLDPWLERLTPKFSFRRQPSVDRSLLRLAAWEITSQTAPAKVVIDEAIEMAKEFSTAESARLINAVLDALLTEHKALTGGGIMPAAPGEKPPVSQPPAQTSGPAGKDE
jgi:transcription antitermination protein NusB